jgi:hypothetical protein
LTRKVMNFYVLPTELALVAQSKMFKNIKFRR